MNCAIIYRTKKENKLYKNRSTMAQILLDYDLKELQKLVGELKQPTFRAKQLFEWITKGCDYDEMSNLPKSFLAELKEKGFLAEGVAIAQVLASEKDFTKKYIFALCDGNVIEGVFMKHKYGNTICVSTQVGCRMNCGFCASGLGGLVRNLTAGEILGQVVAVNRDNILDDGARAITNIVLMGSGEPFDNYDNVTKFLRLVSDENGLNVSKRNISLSTCGICDKIYQLADDGFSPVLTISLHAPNDEIRKSIMPIANKFSIDDIIKAVRYYFEKTGRRIIFEYSMIDGVNDTEENAVQLSRALRGLPCHVNVISLNYVKEKGLKSAKGDTIKSFLAVLEDNNISCSLRRTMGSDIDGACGQLRQSFIESNEK